MSIFQKLFMYKNWIFNIQITFSPLIKFDLDLFLSSCLFIYLKLNTTKSEKKLQKNFMDLFDLQ